MSGGDGKDGVPTPARDNPIEDDEDLPRIARNLTRFPSNLGRQPNAGFLARSLVGVPPRPRLIPPRPSENTINIPPKSPPISASKFIGMPPRSPPMPAVKIFGISARCPTAKTVDIPPKPIPMPAARTSPKAAPSPAIRIFGVSARSPPIPAVRTIDIRPKPRPMAPIKISTAAAPEIPKNDDGNSPKVENNDADAQLDDNQEEEADREIPEAGFPLGSVSTLIAFYLFLFFIISRNQNN